MPSLRRWMKVNTGDTEDPKTVSSAPGGPGPFSEEEVARAAQGLVGEPELEDVEAAEIEERGAEAASFDKLLVAAKTLGEERVRTVLESVLFVADRPLTLDQLFEATGIDRVVLEKCLVQVRDRHPEGQSGVILHEVSGGWQFRTDSSSAEYVRRFLRVKPQRLTRAAVETLSIIAYRQPATRPEVEDIRGVDCGAVIKALLDRRLVKILGKKEEVGRPILYGTTDEFLQFFALKDLGALPTLREFQELTEEHQEIVEKEAPRPTAEGTLEAHADPSFRAKMEESAKASDAALAELEQAMQVAEESSKATSEILNPKEP